jgi:hypothetical protein
VLLRKLVPAKDVQLRNSAHLCGFAKLCYLLCTYMLTRLRTRLLHDSDCISMLSGVMIMVASSLQLIMPGLVVLLDEPFYFLGLAAVGLTFIVTLSGIWCTPRSWYQVSKQHVNVVFRSFRRICITFCVFVVRSRAAMCMRMLLHIRSTSLQVLQVTHAALATR